MRILKESVNEHIFAYVELQIFEMYRQVLRMKSIIKNVYDHVHTS